MAKLTYDQERLHKEACRLVRLDRPLAFDEKLSVLKNFRASSTAQNASDRAHFTPEALARDMAQHEVVGERVIDLCAGIGRLAFHCQDLWGRWPDSSRPLVCIERNPTYVRVGKRILPDATWICADVMTIPQMLDDLGTFDCAISNPPFGAIPRSGDAPGGYRGRRFEYHVIALAALIARRGVFLIPQESASFRFSGRRKFECDNGTDPKYTEYRKFAATTGIELEHTALLDTTYYELDWHDIKPKVEIVRANFAGRAEHLEDRAATEEPQEQMYLLNH
jgi:hypothetical protein